jgi:hypothetical protein
MSTEDEEDDALLDALLASLRSLPANVRAKLVGLPTERSRGRWPVVLRLLKDKYPPSQYPDGFPDPAFAPRQSLVREFRQHPLLKSLDEATLDIAITAYDLDLRNSSE